MATYEIMGGIPDSAWIQQKLDIHLQSSVLKCHQSLLKIQLGGD